MKTKYCPKCKQTVPTSLFQKNRRAKDGLQYHCTPCRKLIERSPVKKERDRKRYHDHKDTYRDQFYQRTYGITLEEYNNMLSSQNYKCAVCKGDCISGRLLAVDHNHTTGKVRGLLCGNCNKALGLLYDNSELISNLFKYIQQHDR